MRNDCRYNPHNKRHSQDPSQNQDQDQDLLQLANSYNQPRADVAVPPRIRSAASGARLYFAIVRDVLRTDALTTLPDFIEAVKGRCARAHIPYAHGEIHRALDLLRRELDRMFRAHRAPHFHGGVEIPRPLSHDEAVAILARLNATVKTMSSVRPITRREQHAADRRTALRMVAEAIKMQIERCEAVEREE